MKFPYKLNRHQIYEMIRHEFGHLMVARHFRFQYGGVTLYPENAGADLDIHLQLPTLAQAIVYLEQRIMILYGGSIGQSLDDNGFPNSQLRDRFLGPGGNATDDMSKIRELTRLLVGLKHPDFNFNKYADQLKKTSIELVNQSATVVQTEATHIMALTEKFISSINSQLTMTRGKEQPNYSISRDTIDAYFAAHDRQS